VAVLIAGIVSLQQNDPPPFAGYGGYVTFAAVLGGVLALAKFLEWVVNRKNGYRLNMADCTAIKSLQHTMKSIDETMKELNASTNANTGVLAGLMSQMERAEKDTREIKKCLTDLERAVDRVGGTAEQIQRQIEAA
jgi:hypothetical protein